MAAKHNIQAYKQLSTFGLTIILSVVFCYGQVAVRSEKPTNNQQSTSIDPSLTSQLFGYAVEKYIIGNLQEAANRLEALAQYTSESHSATLYYLALVNRELGQKQKALESINKAVAMEPDNVEFMKTKVSLLLGDEQFSDALMVLDRVVVQAPNDKETNVLRLLCLYMTGKPAQMMDLANDFEARFGYESRVTGIKSQYYIENKRYEELLAYTDKVAEAEPSAQNLTTLARTLAATGHDSLAVVNYTKAMAIDEGLEALVAFADYKRVKGDALGSFKLVRPILMDSMIRAESKITILTELFQTGAMDDKDGSIRADMDSINTLTADSSFQDFYIDYLLFARDIDGAQKQLENAYAKGELNKEKSTYLLQIYYDKKQMAASLQIAEKLHNEYPDDAQLVAMVLFLNMEQGDVKASLKMCDRLTVMATNDSLMSVAQTTRGDIYQHFGESKKAFKWYKKALATDSLNSTALNNWAYFTSVDPKATQKQLEQALKMATRANAISPLNPTFIDTEAWALFRLGQLTAARQKILLAIGLQKTPSPDLLLHAGDIYNALSERSKAINYWRQALEAGASEADINQRLEGQQP